VGRDLTRYVTTPTAGLGAFAVKFASDFEDAFAGIRKTVSMTKDKYAALDASMKRMTLVKPADYETIAVAEAAGQLGVANHAIEGFTSVMTGLGAGSTDLSTEDEATNLAKLANIMGVTGNKQTNEYFASNLYARSVEVKIISKLPGHASVEITYNRYIHFFEGDIDDTLRQVVGA
jgi:TP901 family phage tail tape measure protein